MTGLGRGYPIRGLAGGVPHPRSGQGGYPISGLAGGTPSQVWPGELPHLRSRGVPGVPPLTRSGWWGGTQGTPYPDLRWGTPLS